MLKKLILILFFSFLYEETHSQIKDVELNLSSKIVKSVLQQNSGLLWVGTDEGLNVFFDDEREVFTLTY